MEHDCREALMAFAQEIVDAHGVDVIAEPTQTITKIRAVLNTRRELSGERATT